MLPVAAEGATVAVNVIDWPAVEGFAPETCQRLAQRLGFDLALPSQCQQAFSADTRSQLDLDL